MIEHERRASARRGLSRRVLRGVLLLALAAPLAASAQDVDLYGYIKAETIYDTRQVANVREGQFVLFPLPDSDGDGSNDTDANAADNFLLTAVQTRLGVRAGGVEAFGATASGTIEADFFGAANVGISEFRLRNAYLQLAWPNRTALFGQYWSPLFTVPVYPQTVSFNTGAPFQPFARQPQVRLTLRPSEGVQIVGAIAGQRDAFAEIGGPKLQQQSGLPMAHLQGRFGSGGSLVGGGAYIKRIRPTLAAEEEFTAGAVQGYARYQADRFFVQGKVTYGTDLTDHLMTGGYLALDDGTYEPLGVVGTWLDAGTTGRPVDVGVFAGYLATLGAADELAAAVVGGGVRTPNLKRTWRVAPRVSARRGPVRFAAEVEVSTALFTTGGFEADYAPIEAASDEPVTNVRGLFAAYYIF